MGFKILYGLVAVAMSNRCAEALSRRLLKWDIIVVACC